ncbi:tyrosine-type recombinase/integrase [Rhizobium sp. UGM030330-04]|uniref:tyrosine-type recombinase/integrase n=1 Tax=Pseudomonadota TaxID=1224 RepID=UPI001AECEA5B|nr:MULTISPECIES: Arm DNA-binding domain-containing protein [Pseudomonadota]
MDPDRTEIRLRKLTPYKVATAGPEKHEDGGGLRLVVSRTGAWKWRLRLTLHGKRREMGPGSFANVGLAEARERAAEYRKQVKHGPDPIAVRQIIPAAPTFTACATRYVRVHRHGWTSAKHARQWVSTLKTYARPVISSKRMDATTTEDILKVLSPLWIGKTGTAKRVRGCKDHACRYLAWR